MNIIFNLNNKMQKKIVRLLPKDVVFMECDIQEKMRKLILNFDSLAHNA